MTHLTIQLTFNFDHTEQGFGRSLQLLAFFVEQGDDLYALRTYHQMFKALMICRSNNTFSDDVFARLQSRLVAFHNDVLALNGVY